MVVEAFKKGLPAESAGSAPTPPPAPAPFSFAQKTTASLNIPGMVTFSAGSNSYKLTFGGKDARKKSRDTDVNGAPLKVEGEFGTQEEFLAAKTDVFKRAIDAWNMRDASKKPRITL